MYGGHAGEEKTKERIKLSFVGPQMKGNIVKFCKSYAKCQFKARRPVTEVFPISPNPREDVAFKRMTLYVVDSNDAVSASDDKYSLCDLFAKG